MTPAQLQTFADDIENNTNQTVIDALAAGNNNGIRSWYNETASPDFWVFKGSIPVDSIVGAMDWATDYAAFKDDMDAIRFILDNGTYDPQPVNARNALSEIFSGATNTKAAILAVATQKATYFQKLFSTSTSGPGGGNGSAQGQSALASILSDCTLQNVRDAVALIGG